MSASNELQKLSVELLFLFVEKAMPTVSESDELCSLHSCGNRFRQLKQAYLVLRSVENYGMSPRITSARAINALSQCPTGKRA